MSEKFQAVVQCDFIDSLGESLKEPAQSVLRAMGSGADTTQLCGYVTGKGIRGDVKIPSL